MHPGPERGLIWFGFLGVTPGLVGGGRVLQVEAGVDGTVGFAAPGTTAALHKMAIEDCLISGWHKHACLAICNILPDHTS